MRLKKTELWRRLREISILARHRRVAAVCRQLIDDYRSGDFEFELRPKQNPGTQRIIWQYWGQGYGDLPPVVKECLDSVERHAEEFQLIRLSDANISDYLDIPDFVQEKRNQYSRTHFSDILRLMLLHVYGGVWLDATVMLSAALPAEYADCSFFAYRRDPEEPHKRYWRNTYAYYFGWAKGFRVNMLNSVLFAKKGDATVAALCGMMLLWWKEHSSLPDYFFFQILCDVYGLPDDMPLASDTLPHCLQQSVNDPDFRLMPREDILRTIPIHKLTYK